MPLDGQVLLLAAAVVVLLLAFASGYGYHRDELYFLVASRHLDWAYPDQGPLTPLIAWAMIHISRGSLTVLRVPSALASAGTVIVTSLLARELGATRRAEWIAAAVAAVAVIVLFSGHLLSTSTFDLLDWTVLSWLVVRAVRNAEGWLFVIAGGVLGIGLLNKPLPAFLAVGLLVGVVMSGPRRLLTNRHVWAGAVLALALWSPWLAWQSAHGWPQITVSQSLAAGHSVSSQPWWAVVPFQALLVSPPLIVVWTAGLVRLFKDPELRDARFLGWTWVTLAVVFMASGGKPYYLAGLLPLLIGAGAASVDRWLERGSVARAVLLAVVIALCGIVDAVIALPILPARDAGPVVAANADVGETIGWPQLARTVERVYRRLSRQDRPVIFTANYGEAGAIDRYGPALGLPAAYSGHNAFGLWGPPPDGSRPVLTIGLRPNQLARHFRGCATVARINDGVGIDNDEQRQPVSVCAAPLRPWGQEWPSLRHLG